MVRASGDRVDLAAEGRDPPAVRDVGRDDVEADDLVDRHDQAVDRDRAARVVELPVELMRLDLHADLARARARRRHVLDPRELVEDERGDRGEDQHRADRPGQLQVRVPADLRPLDLPSAAAASEADDEDDEHDLDQHEDERGEAEDEPVGIVDAVRVRRPGRDRRDPAVRRRGDVR